MITVFSTTANCFGNVKKKVEPTPGLEVSQILPPYNSTIFFACVRPTPVLSNWSLA